MFSFTGAKLQNSKIHNRRIIFCEIKIYFSVVLFHNRLLIDILHHQQNQCTNKSKILFSDWLKIDWPLFKTDKSFQRLAHFGQSMRYLEHNVAIDWTEIEHVMQLWRRHCSSGRLCCAYCNALLTVRSVSLLHNKELTVFTSTRSVFCIPPICTNPFVQVSTWAVQVKLIPLSWHTKYQTANGLDIHNLFSCAMMHVGVCTHTLLGTLC